MSDVAEDLARIYKDLLRPTAAARIRVAVLVLFLSILCNSGCAFFNDEGESDIIIAVNLSDRIDPIFVFAVIADPHIPDSRMFPPQDDYRYLKAMSVAEDLLEVHVQDINSHSQDVDFTLVLGDISDKGKAWELNRAAAILNELDAPYYPVVGNHDNFQDDNKQAWKDAFGRDSTSYIFIWEGFKFIVIDPTLDPYDPPDHTVRFDEDLRDWVRSELEDDPEMPTFLVGHYPLLNRCWSAEFRVFERVGQTCLAAEDDHITEDPPVSERGYPDPEHLNYYRVYQGGRELREVLEDYGNVIASLNGHVHANRAEEHNGITYIDVAATLVGSPCIRYFYVYSNRVEVDFEYISDGSLLSHVRSLCPNCLRCSYPDRVCGFIGGRLEDRRFTVWVGQR